MSQRLKSAALIVACWCTFGVLLGQQTYAVQAGQGPAGIWSHALILQLNYCLVWAAATPLVLRLGRRFPLVALVRPTDPQRTARGWRSLVVHLIAGVACALIVQSAHSLLLPRLYPRWFPPVPLSLLRRSLMSTVDYGVILYWVLLLIGQSVEYLRRSDEARVRQAQLQEELAEAQLQALRMQMHPHFLFNALNSVAALIPDEPATAEHMLTRLGELLRIYLRSSELQEITLLQEIDFLRRYLEIQKLRFEERLEVHIRLDPAAESATVPSLILQPLVENAIVHGIADRDRGGSIEIDAAVEGAELSLRVADNGSDSHEHAPAGFRQGTGLGNTRRRLERLYGSQHGFSVEALANGGICASISHSAQAPRLEAVMTVATLATIIVDDERLARKRLAQKLSKERVEVVGECESVQKALDLLAQRGADLLFLDVEMPRASGIELAKAMQMRGDREAPAIVFVTAHERYAVQAFELRACDYLLKPFSDERLRLALARVREVLHTRDRAEPAPVQSNEPSAEERTGVVLVRTASKVLRIKLESIDWIEAAGNYVNLHVGATSHLLRETITAFESRLPRGRFARIHRTAIANLDRIVEFEPMLSGDFEVLLHGGVRLRMSRTYRRRIRDLFGHSISARRRGPPSSALVSSVSSHPGRGPSHKCAS